MSEPQFIENDELPERDDIPIGPHEHEQEFQADERLGFMRVLAGE